MLRNQLIKNGRSSLRRRGGAAAAWRCRECGRQDLRGEGAHLFLRRRPTCGTSMSGEYGRTQARPPQTSTTCFAIHIGHYLQADLAAFADGGVNGFLDHAIWVRCHSTPSRSFLEPPICPSLHNLSPQETPSLPYHSSTRSAAGATVWRRCERNTPRLSRRRPAWRRSSRRRH